MTVLGSPCLNHLGLVAGPRLQDKTQRAGDERRGGTVQTEPRRRMEVCASVNVLVDACWVFDGHPSRVSRGSHQLFYYSQWEHDLLIPLPPPLLFPPSQGCIPTRTPLPPTPLLPLRLIMDGWHRGRVQQMLLGRMDLCPPHPHDRYLLHAYTTPPLPTPHCRRSDVSWSRSLGSGCISSIRPLPCVSQGLYCIATRLRQFAYWDYLGPRATHLRAHK